MTGVIPNGGRAGSRATILAAAVHRVACDGYDGARLRDIAHEANVSVGLLQHRFGVREHLLAQALEHHCAALRHIDAVWRGSLLDAIEEGVAGGEPHPVLRAATVAELVMSMIGGAPLAIGGGAARIDGARMHDQILEAAAALLGRSHPHTTAS